MFARLLIEEAKSLQPVRRAVVTIVLLVPWLQLGLTILANRDELLAVSWAFYVYTAIYAVVAAATSRRTFALVGPLLPLLLVVAPWFLSGPSWVNVNVSVTAIVVLTSLIFVPVVSVALAALCGVLYVVTLQADLPVVLTTGASLAGGAFHFIQLMSVAAMVSFFWKKLNAVGRAHDQSLALTEREISSLRARQDRLVHWRRVASRLETSVLTFIERSRHSGTGESFDLDRELASLHESRALRNPMPRVVVQDVAQEFLGKLEIEFVADSATAESPADLVTAEILRDVLFEFAMAARHSGASKVLVYARAMSDRMLFVISDDALGRAPENLSLADLGLVRNRIRLAGATMALSNDSAGNVNLTLVVPHQKKTAQPEIVSDFRWGLADAGDRMVAAIMGGVLVASIPVAALLQLWWPGAYLPAISLGLLSGCLLMLFLMSQKRLSTALSIFISSLSIITLVATSIYAPGCQELSPIHYVLNGSGYSLLIVFMIGSRSVAGISFIAWFISVLQLIRIIPDECESIAWYSLANTLILVPFGLVVWFVSKRAFASAQKRAARLQQMKEEAAQQDQVIHEVIDDVELLLTAASHLLTKLREIPGDPTVLQELRVVESRLRIRAQVDPLIAGPTARLLIEFVDEVAARGEWIEIGTIAVSQYQMELPEQVIDAAEKIAQIIGSGRKLNFFTTEDDEIVSHTLTRQEADQVADLFTDWEMTNSGWAAGDVQVDIDLSSSEDPAAPVLIVWSRPIRRVPGLGIPERRARARV